MKNYLSFALTILALSATNAFSQETSNTNEIQWMSFEEALEASKEEPKMWFIDMYTDWCGWCKRMDASTFKDSLITEVMNGNYYAVKFNAEQKEDIVVGDSTYSFVASGRRGYHELAAQLMNGKLSYPTFVFLNERLEVLTTVPGYKESKDMHPILEFMAQYDPVTNPQDYQTFLQGYESPYIEPEKTGN